MSELFLRIASGAVGAVVGGVLSYFGLYFTSRHQDKKQDERIEREFQEKRNFYLETHIIQLIEDGVEIGNEMGKRVDILNDLKLAPNTRITSAKELKRLSKRMQMVAIDGLMENQGRVQHNILEVLKNLDTLENILAQVASTNNQTGKKFDEAWGKMNEAVQEIIFDLEESRIRKFKKILG